MADCEASQWVEDTIPKVPWRVGRVVNIRALTSLFTRVGRSHLHSGRAWGESGEFGPELSSARSPSRLSIALRPFFPASGMKCAQ
ncbi:hypothetical protein TPA0906_13240 [Streptomyces olivaceus]|nr:hypothetical protein TPA0906_13240 [Streptomyces olivaceus]